MLIDRRYSLQIVGEVLKQLTEDKCKDNYITLFVMCDLFAIYINEGRNILDVRTALKHAHKFPVYVFCCLCSWLSINSTKAYYFNCIIKYSLFSCVVLTLKKFNTGNRWQYYIVTTCGKK